ncbi:Nn.00g111090.m01.CDS01 [Neocucurbitaria sp. VM-36]
MACNLLAGQHDTQKERPPPSRPIPVTFPYLQPPEPSISTPPAPWASRQTGISAHFLSLRKPSDVTKETLSLLNVTFQPDCDFETLLSSLSNNAQSHLPPRSWLDSPGNDEPSTKQESKGTLLSNGRKAPERREFHVRARELFFQNGDAFSTLTRKGNGGQAPLRLAHFRKFWEGLDNMAYYWDTSLDEYSPPVPEAANHGSETTPPISTKTESSDETNETRPDGITRIETGFGAANEEEPRKKAKTEAVGDHASTQSFSSKAYRSVSVAPHTSSTTPIRALPARTMPPKVPWAANIEPHSKPADLSNGSYRGYRIGNGAEMPDQYRVDCVRAFLEPIAWAFNVTLSPHRRPPVLTLAHVRFPVRMSSVAWRGPQDRVKARQGWMEGPILGVQCRADVNFGATGNMDAESVLDTVRELGGLLLLAQERAREGSVEKRGGEGAWWTTKERWGGGPGGEVGEASGANDAPMKDITVKMEEKSTERNRDGSKVRRKPTPAEVWKSLKPGNPLWDPKVVYEAIGTNRSIEWDDVFMVSSLNHHISLLKLRVHPLYLQYLTEGKLPDEVPSDLDWCSPKLMRTRWFDLFNVEDRTEAMRGIWGVMSYLMRRAEDNHQDTAMNDG